MYGSKGHATSVCMPCPRGSFSNCPLVGGGGAKGWKVPPLYLNDCFNTCVLLVPEASWKGSNECRTICLCQMHCVNNTCTGDPHNVRSTHVLVGHAPGHPGTSFLCFSLTFGGFHPLRIAQTDT